MTNSSGNNICFFLGGHDLEMLTIRELLRAHATDQFCDKGLSWGAKASAYRDEIEQALASGLTPVLVELENDIELGQDGIVVVDHHGPLAGAAAPTALHQVFGLLGLPPEAWTRRLELVAANDRGHIAGMAAVGATREEIVAIRAADRAAQGITADEERQGEAALETLRTVGNGRLTIVDLPHNRTATVTDRLAPELGGSGYENLLVISPGEVNFYGDGHLITALAERFPGGWYGGNLPERGFWGHGGPVPELIPFVEARLADYR